MQKEWEGLVSYLVIGVPVIHHFSIFKFIALLGEQVQNR